MEESSLEDQNFSNNEVVIPDEEEVYIKKTENPCLDLASNKTSRMNFWTRKWGVFSIVQKADFFNRLKYYGF